MSATIDDVLAGRARWCVIESDNAPALAAMPDGCVDHVITDPPYTQRTSDNAKSAPHGKKGSALSQVHSYITFDGVDGQEGDIAAYSLRLARRWCVVFCALEQIGVYAESAGPAWVRGTVWLRSNPAPQFTGDRPGQSCEGVAIMHRRGKRRWNRGGAALTFVGPTANSVGDKTRGLTGHPTPKPEWLMVDAIDAFTDPEDVILDPFCGSGTTGVAAIRLGRRFIGIERDPKYAAVARERLAAESQGLTLRQARAGQTSLFGGGS